MTGWLILHAAIAAMATWAARRYAIGRDLIDHPGERRSHAVATPRGGGIALVLALLVAACALAFREPQHRVLLAAFVVGITMVAVAGLVDDHRPLSPWLRLLVHALAGLVFGAAMQLTFDLPWLSAVAVLAVLVLTNIWNFMDGINGIAASQAMVVGIALAWGAGGVWAWLALALVAACIGFLPFNFPRARIFMGDVGSGALGFAVAAIGAVALAQRGPVGLLVLLPLSAFLVDAGLTLLRRVLRGERWWTAHTQHAYQVGARQVGHTIVTSIYVAWTALGLAMASVLASRGADVAVAVGTAWYLAAAFAWWAVQRLEPGMVSNNNKGNA